MEPKENKSKNGTKILAYFRSIGYGPNDLIPLGDITKGGTDIRLDIAMQIYGISGARLDLDFPYDCPCGERPRSRKGVVYSIADDRVIHIGPICFDKFSNIKKERLKCKCGTRLANYSRGLLCSKCRDIQAEHGARMGRLRQAEMDKQDRVKAKNKIE